jgi:hypothetical protein
MPTPTAVLIKLIDEERGRLEAWRRGLALKAPAVDVAASRCSAAATEAQASRHCPSVVPREAATSAVVAPGSG